jgi:hypothetical protein
MNKMIMLVALTSMIACSTTNEDPYASCTAFDEVDANMLQLIEQVNQKHVGNKSFLEAFKMEQVYWIQYRDRRIRSMYPKNWDRFYRKNYGRETFNSCKCQELLRLAENRMDDLNMYLVGGPRDQESCPSMLNE